MLDSLFFPNHDTGSMLGMAAIVRTAYSGGNLAQIGRRLDQRLAVNAADAGALMDMSLILEVKGRPDNAAELQRLALTLRRSYEIANGKSDGLRILAFKVAGNLMANTPIEFLLEGSDDTLINYYVDENTADLNDLPPHDVAIVAIGESTSSAAVLQNLERLLADWHGPVVNGTTQNISSLTRPGVRAKLSGLAGVMVPEVTVVDRDRLTRLAHGAVQLSDAVSGFAFPVLLRPIGSHAGHGLMKIDSESDIAIYLGEQPQSEFYMTQFVDYAGPDGLFRKFRVAVIDGKPFASHLAVSSHWMVHYLNADMEQNAERRAEEAEWMMSFETRFAQRHAAAISAMARELGLDYFAIDCAETSDGRLLLFETDVAMIVHSLDSAEVFPYKKPAMKRLFAGFHEALQRRGEAARAMPLLA